MAAPDLERLLEALLEPDSGAIRRATAGLREAFADPQTPARLGLLLRAAPRPQVRQLAAVLLRRRLLGRWRRLDPALRQRLPALLAEALERETEHTVTVALAQLGALVLRRGGLGAWGPLGTWAQAAARDPQPGRQEAAMLVLSAALEAAPQALAPHGHALAALCRGALAPGGPPGPVAYSLRALGGLAAMLGGTQTELLRSLLPDILAALKGLLDTDEDRGAEALEVLDEFLEADPGAVTPHLRPLLDLCLQVGGDESRGDPVRVRALATVTFLAQKCPKALLRGGLLGPILGGLLTPLCADPPPGRPDPEEEEEEEGAGQGGAEGRAGPSPRHAAAQALDALAMGLPPEKLLQHLVPLLEPPLRSPRAGARKGALLALGALAGGCGGALRRRYLGPTLGALRGGLGDPESCVRGAAACALRSLADCLQPEVAGVAGRRCRGRWRLWGGPGRPPPRPGTSWRVCSSVWGRGWGRGSPGARGHFGGAGARGAPPERGAGTQRPPLPRLHGRGAAAAPRGPDPGGSDPPPAAGAPRDAPAAPPGPGFVLAGAVAEALGEGMGPLLPRVVPVLLGTLRRPPPAAPPEAPDSFLLFDDEDEDEDEEPMEEEEEEDEEEELIEVEVSVAFAREVEDACEALGEVAEHSRAAFLPFLEPSLEAVMGLVEFPQSGVRGAAYETLGSLCLALGGAPAPPDGTAPPLERVLEALLGAIRGDPAPGGGPGGAGGVGADPGGARPRPPARSAGSHWAAAG
ncbi:importin-4-like isoform X2 [Athene noctua]|uniref:importin-4-like isoform X2 n=1 Tax=Athene noctua TaxID=126797 RepID=UPI003EC0F43A